MSSVELREVKSRIATTGQIRQVTSAMQQVATARLGNDRRVAEVSIRYTQRLLAVLREVRGALGDVTHPYLQTDSRGPIGLLVIGSDRGLCGGYHSMLMEKVAAFADERGRGDLRLFTVGKIVTRRARRMGLTVEQSFPQPTRPGSRKSGSSHGSDAGVREITAAVTRQFETGACRELHGAYVYFVSGYRQEPTTERVLPMALGDSVQSQFPGAGFEPAPRVLLDTLLLEYARQLVEHMFLHSVASENAARQVAMSRASENASDMLRELKLRYSRLRQESITTEMLELAGAGAAGRRV